MLRDANAQPASWTKAGNPCVHDYINAQPQQQRNAQLDIMTAFGADPVSKQAAAISDLAAAIRELADVLYQINTDD